MADTQVDATIDANTQGYTRAPTGAWFIDPDVGGVVYPESGLDLEWRKFTAFSTSPAIGATPADISTQVCRSWGTWHDPWTPGLTGPYVHVVIFETSTDDLIHFRIDTTDDSLSSEVTIVAESAVVDGTSTKVSVVKSRSNLLYVAAKGGTTNKEYFCVSTDEGDTWDNTLANPFEGASGDSIILMPGAETDPDDILGFFMDLSAGVITVKTYDASLDSWSESATIATLVNTSAPGFPYYACAPRHSDNHTILIVDNAYLDAGGDVECYDVTNGTTWTQKTNVLSNVSRYNFPAVLVNQQNGDIYVFLNEASVTGQVVYYKSTDGGATWAGPTAYGEDAGDDNRAIYMPCSIGAVGGQIVPIWCNDDLGDAFLNLTNKITVPAAALVERPEARARARSVGTIAAMNVRPMAA